MSKFALIGCHLGHTKSPLLHNIIHERMGIDARYDVLDIEGDKLEEAISLLKTGVYQGFNVTIPHKVTVMKYLDEISPEAKKVGAVNTICMKNGKVVGFNTDFFGFHEELKKYNVDVHKKNVALIGCGGAARAILAVLKDLEANILVCERDLSLIPSQYKGVLSKDLEKYDYEILINASPVGMYPNIDNMAVSEAAAKKPLKIVDVIYNPEITKLMSYCSNSYNGLYMLALQGIKSNEIWFDTDLSDMYEDIYNQFKGGI